MLQEQRMQEISDKGTIDLIELEPIGENQFKSIEFYQILHFTNEEWYYTADENCKNLKDTADETHETERGLYFCFS